jgi:hypothetical protein
MKNIDYRGLYSAFLKFYFKCLFRELPHDSKHSIFLGKKKKENNFILIVRLCCGGTGWPC